MKKMIALVLVLVALFSLVSAHAEMYAKMFLVVLVSREDNAITLMDTEGWLYQWEGCSDWMEGDIAGAIMDDKETSIILDDEIISLTYNGWLEQWEIMQYDWEGGISPQELGN